MFERIARLRAVIGARIVKFGVQVAGFDPGKLAHLPDVEEPEDELDDELPITTYQTVELNERAKEMVREGMIAQSPTRAPVPAHVPLAGSAAARLAEERRKIAEAMRPKR